MTVRVSCRLVMGLAQKLGDTPAPWDFAGFWATLAVRDWLRLDLANPAGGRLGSVRRPEGMSNFQGSHGFARTARTR